MSETPAANSSLPCPYVGLMPFSESEAAYFFGREDDIKIVASNLRAAPLTIFYGSSGVGKSSLLNAGVVPYLQKMTTTSTLEGDPPEFILVGLRDWANNPVESLRLRVPEAVEKAVRENKIPGLTLAKVKELAAQNAHNPNLTAVLRSWTDLLETDLLIILDQFESFFLHPEFAACPGSFGEELPKVLNAKGLSVHFLISLRDDAVSKLDYFKNKIPDLLHNMIRLYHLGRDATEKAIREPLGTYNEKAETTFSIEDDLVKQVLNDVQVNKIHFDSQGQANIKQFKNAPGVTPVNYQAETPYLQLVMKRLWREELSIGSNVLRLGTLTQNLGGVEQIIKTHLDSVMKKLSKEEQRIAADCFKYMVTPMGTKIALTPEALAKYTDEAPSAIKATLEALINSKPGPSTAVYDINAPVPPDGVRALPDEARILRTVEVPVHDTKLQAYEVTHDALIPAIQDWRARYTIEHSALNQIKRYTKLALPFILAAGLAVAAITFLLSRYKFDIDANANTNEWKVKIKRNQEEAAIANNKAEKAENTAQIALRNEKQAENDKVLVQALLKLSGGSQDEKKVAIDKLKQLIEMQNISPEYQQSVIELVSRIDRQKASELRAAANKANNPGPKPTPAPTPDASSQPHVFIQITDKSQKDNALQIQSLLKANKINAPGIELVKGLTLSKTQIRYFYQHDAATAQEISRLLLGQGIGGVQVQYIQGYEGSLSVEPGQVELWFANDAFANAKQ